MSILNIVAILSLTAIADALQTTVCELRLGFVNCPVGRVVQIDTVMYGRTQKSVCNTAHVQFGPTNCQGTQTSTDAVRMACEGRSTCILTADNTVLGEDPCPAVPKYLHVQYQCVTTLTPRASTPSTTTTAATTTTQSTSTQTTPTSTQTTPTITPTTTPTSTTTTRTTITTKSRATIQTNITPPSNKNGTAVHVCHEYLVSGPRGVQDGQLSSSSSLSLGSNSHRARLYLETKKYASGLVLEGGWTAAANDRKPWVQVSLNWLAIIQGVVTQGRHVNPDTGCCPEWTTKYKVSYSIDGQHWDTLKDGNNQDKIFIGNTDTDTPITHLFDCPITARYLRIEPVDQVGRPSLRFDVIGCPTNADDVGKCPKGWKERPGSDTCYYISDQSDLKTWENAMITCRRRQGDILKIDSIQERYWLRFQLQAIQRSQKLGTWWVGLNNRPRYDNKDYKWQDGTPLNTNVLTWNPPEPDNVGGVEHCAAYRVTVGTLGDLDCDRPMPFVCELHKFWTPPVNTPGLVTRLPTPQTTLAPSTATYKVPVPAGGSGKIVTTAHNVFPLGCIHAHQGECQGKAWADYHSCSGCHYYLTCAPNGEFVRACPVNLKYDANVGRCSQTSSTCMGP